MSEKKDKSKANLSIVSIAPALAGLESADAPMDVVSVLLFEIGGDALGISVEHTEGVVDCPRITPLPSAPDRLIGVASVRGRMTLVMDLSGQANPSEGKRRLILLKGENQIGLLAERVEGVVALEPEKVRKHKGDDRAAQDDDNRRVAPEYFKHEGRRVPLLDAASLAEV